MVETAIPHPGDTIGGKYRVERALGRGGMGAVFEVVHRVTHKRFAIKWLMSEPSSNSDAVTRFVREAQVAGRCEHSNIVEVYDLDRHNGQLFMVMELLKGESLAERLLRCPSGIAHHEACRLLLPCIEAIADAHSAGIIHRDIKPANLFICQARGRDHEYAKVLDFGVSRFVTPDGQFEIGAQTRSGAIIGTPFYMAPEQMRGHPIDARADVYSMGITLYETLCGHRPYEATSYGDLLLKVTAARLTPVSDIVPGLPRPLCDVVARAMATDPAMRFASMGELARALLPFAGAPLNPSQLSFRGATLHTPLVSETPPVHQLAMSGGARRPLHASLKWWIVLGVFALLGLFAWRPWSDRDGHVVRVAAPSTSQAAATVAPEPPAAAPTAAAVNDQALSPLPMGKDPNDAQEPKVVSPEPVTTERRPAATPPSTRRAHPARGKRRVVPADKRAARGRDSVALPDRTRRKARAPAHLERSEF